VEGADRSAWLQGHEGETDRAVPICCVTPFGEWTRANGGREYRGLRTSRYTYVRSLDGPWLLYDNQNDPYQQHNLAGVAPHADLQKQLDARLMDDLKRRKDEFRPGGEYLKRWGYATDKTGTVRYKP
jgi:hypothetical protein